MWYNNIRCASIKIFKMKTMWFLFGFFLVERRTFFNFFYTFSQNTIVCNVFSRVCVCVCVCVHMEMVTAQKPIESSSHNDISFMNFKSEIIVNGVNINDTFQVQWR